MCSSMRRELLRPKVQQGPGGEVLQCRCVLSLACSTRFVAELYVRAMVGVEIGEQGIENALELEKDVPEKVRTGHFVGDCFIYTNSAGRLNYYVGGEVITLA